ncbi:tetratricopeptide repeat protein, partial [Candidatus Poribacteria bacterium]|nr:tetratricopeptide repeat protein [Candidatus Poribacteria bacterium]
LIGEPGVGKSRLAVEFLQSAGVATTRTLRAACLSYTTRAPYYLFQELLKSWAGVAPSDTPDVVRAELQGALGSLDADLGEWEPYLQVLLAPGDEAAAEALANLDPQTRQRLTDRAIVETLHAIAGSGSVVVACDDLHWIDEASERVLGRLVDGVTDVPLLVLAIYRQEFDPKWPESSWTRLRLEALPDDHTRALVSALLGGAELPEAFVELVGSKSSGNPYFVEEVLRSFVDSGALTRVGGEWRLDEDADAADVPDALQAVIMGRLDSTPEECRRIMQIASVIGHEFGSDMLGELGWGLSEAAASLEYLRSLGMLTETQPVPEQRHAFRQEFVREVSYETLLLSARRELHGQVADATEQLQGRGASPALLLDHSVKAQRWANGVQYALRSAAEARDVYANRAAAAYYDQALELMDRVAEDDPAHDGSRDRIAVLEGLGAVHSLMGEYDESMTAYEGMLEQTGSLQETAPDEGRVRRAEALRSLASVHVRRGEYDQALGRLEEAVTVLEGRATDDARRESSNALAQIASVHFQRGEYDLTREFSQRSHTIADEIGAAREAAFANLIWGLAAYRQGDAADARERFETSLAARERLGDINGVAAVLQNLGNLSMDQTDYDGAEGHYTQCLAIRRKVGDVAGTANVLNGLGNVCLARVDYDGAAQRFGECLEIFEGIGAGFGIAVATLNLGAIENERENLDAARDYLRRALEAAGPLKARDLIADITAATARVNAEAGDWDAAGEAATDALTVAREMANPGIEAKALWALATVTLAAGDHGMAREHFTVGVAASRSAELKLWEARLLLGRAAAEQAAGSTTAASADLDAAEAAFPTPRPARDARRVRELRAALDA